MKTVICPVCWHEETWMAIKQCREPIHDDASTMLWHRPEGGVRGQMITIWDCGYWRCKVCDISLPPHMAAVMIDAVLRVSDPDSDSYDVDQNIFSDSVVAASGGK